MGAFTAGRSIVVLRLDCNGRHGSSPPYACSSRARCGQLPQRSIEVAMRCPLWVISCHGTVKLGCPLYPRKRTRRRKPVGSAWANSRHPVCGAAQKWSGRQLRRPIEKRSRTTLDGRGIEALDIPVLPRAAGFDVGGLGADCGNPLLHRLGHELRSMSDRMCPGTPRRMKRSDRTPIISTALSFIAHHDAIVCAAHKCDDRASMPNVIAEQRDRIVEDWRLWFARVHRCILPMLRLLVSSSWRLYWFQSKE